MKVFLFFLKSIFRLIIVFAICCTISVFFVYKYTNGDVKGKLEQIIEKLKHQVESAAPSGIGAEMKEVRDIFKKNKFKLK